MSLENDLGLRVATLELALEEIAEFAHIQSTGPAVPDALWQIRGMAYTAINQE